LANLTVILANLRPLLDHEEARLAYLNYSSTNPNVTLSIFIDLFARNKLALAKSPFIDPICHCTLIKTSLDRSLRKAGLKFGRSAEEWECSSADRSMWEEIEKV
jgi:hypothetical protein